jgi:predicted nucleic acid-binding protein
VIILDTNVISETLRPVPNDVVRAWFDAQDDEALYLCAPVLAEMRFGVERLAAGAKQQWLREEVDRLEHQEFSRRVLPFDATAAMIYGRIVAERERSGRPMAVLDGMIAAIALQHDAVVATRDTRDFALPDLTVVDPFDFGK